MLLNYIHKIAVVTVIPIEDDERCIFMNFCVEL